MEEEISLADLETAQKNLAQKLSAHVMKREAFELKFQEEITSMATNINGKLDDLIKSLDSIQSQLLNFGKGKVVDAVGKLGPIVGESSGPFLEEICNKSQLPHTNNWQIEQTSQETLKPNYQEHDNDYIVPLESLFSDDNLDKFAPLSPSNIKNNSDSTLGFHCPEALHRKDGIGVTFSMKNETTCKFLQSPLKIVVPGLNKEFEFDVVFNSAGKWGSSTTACSEIHLGKNIGPNSSYSPELCLIVSVFWRDIPMEKLTKEKIHIHFVVVCHLASSKSTTTEHLTYKLGATDKRFVERFKKEVAKMNHKSFEYRGNFDKNEVEGGPGVTIDVSVLSLKLPNGLVAKVSHDGQTHEQQMNCCLIRMGATVPQYRKVSYDEIIKKVPSYLKKGYHIEKILFVDIGYQFGLMFSKLWWIERLTDTLMRRMIATSFLTLRVVLVLGFECQGIIACVRIGTRRKMTIFSVKVQELAGCQPFESLQVVDLLLLQGNFELVVAKQATLYFPFDWQSDYVDVVVVRFGIMRLESVVFYLLDNHIIQALERACLQLLGMAELYIYPKVTQALLEKQNLAILMVLQLRRDGAAARLVSLGKINTICWIRVECVVQIGAYIYHRLVCTTVMVKELKGICLIGQVISIPKTCFCNKMSLEEKEFKEFAPYLNRDCFYRWLSYASEESTLFQGEILNFFRKLTTLVVIDIVVQGQMARKVLMRKSLLMEGSGAWAGNKKITLRYIILKFDPWGQGSLEGGGNVMIQEKGKKRK